MARYRYELRTQEERRRYLELREAGYEVMHATLFAIYGHIPPGAKNGKG